MPITAIIVAAGTSRRMGFDKLAAPLNGKPILAHTLDLFLNCQEITEVILVCPEDRFNQLLDKTTFTKPVYRIQGGAERHLSVANGLAAVSDATTLVAIHDAARPLTSQADIRTTIAAARTHKAATLAHRATETLKRSDSNNFTTESIPRENLWHIETPQIFEKTLINTAYKHIITHHLLVTDETSALQAINHPTKLVESTSPNPKITTPTDLEALTQISDH